jgi:hypothetical protein
LINYREAVEFFLILALFSDLPVYKASYDLLLAIFRFTKDFSKDYKYTVGESIKKETIVAPFLCPGRLSFGCRTMHYGDLFSSVYPNTTPIPQNQ